MTATTVEQPSGGLAWYARSARDVTAQLGVDAGEGLAVAEVERRLAEYGPNELPTELPPSMWVVAREQLVNPMNIMLLIVVAASFAIVQIATALVALGLVLFNVIMGTSQELKARASVEALAKLQVPHARPRRSGQVAEIASTKLVPGDIVLLEAGDVVPADGRIISSATLEVQESALTGESAPVPKDPSTLPGGETALGDRTNLVFQNTQVTRGTTMFVVTATGSATEMGRIAGMVTATKRTKSPLQRELDGLTKVFGLLAFLAVAVIAIFGIVRGQDTTTLVLLCISTAIASIPTGLPTFVQAMLSSGARRLAESKAVVKSLSDVETLGGTTVINSDKTGTLTMNAMTATTTGVMITVGLAGLAITIGLLSMIEVGQHLFGSVPIGQSIAFTAFALCLIVAAVECRSETGTALTTATFDSKQMNWAMLGEFVLAVLVTQMDVFNRLLGTTQLNLRQFGWALIPALALLVLWELGKYVARRRQETTQGG